MSYRYDKDLREDYAGRAQRQIRGMISARELADHDGQTANAIGREAADGSYEEDHAPIYGPLGVAARPEANAVVESIVGLVGASGDHPAILGQIDTTRAAVIDATSLGADETIVYTSQVVVHLKSDGTAEIRSLGGTAKSVAFLEALTSVNDRISALEAVYNTHTHVISGTPPVTAAPVPQGATSATVTGTTVAKLE